METVKWPQRLADRYRRLRSRERCLVAFCLVIYACFVCMLAISAICTAVTGQPFFVGCSVFFQDVGDACMDFFNVNGFVQDMDPYTGAGSSYPPMVLLFAKLFQLVQGSGDSMKAVRLTPRGIISVCLFMLLFFVLAWLLLRAYMKRYSVHTGLAICTYIALLLSSPMLFCIDRGNYLLYCFLFVGFFLLEYRAEKMWLRELSYVSLALAVSFKLYPAVFGFLLLNRKDWLNLVKTAMYSVILLLVPFVFFRGGFMHNLQAFAGNLIMFQAQNEYSYADGMYWLTGYFNNVSLAAFVKMWYLIFSGGVLDQIPGYVDTAAAVAAILLAVICIAAVYFTQQEWVRMYLLTSVMTFVIKTSYEYSLIFYIFPLLMYIMQHGEGDMERDSDRPGKGCKEGYGHVCREVSGAKGRGRDREGYRYGSSAREIAGYRDGAGDIQGQNMEGCMEASGDRERTAAAVRRRRKALDIAIMVLYILICMPLPLGYAISKHTHGVQLGYPVLNIIQCTSYLACTVLLVALAVRSFARRKRHSKAGQDTADNTGTAGCTDGTDNTDA